MKSFQLSLTLLLSLLFIACFNNTTIAQSPTTAPTTQNEIEEARRKAMEAKRKAAKEKATKGKARRAITEQEPNYCVEGPGIFYESQIVEIKREVLERGIPENPNYKGTVVFNICINRSGNVIYSKYNRNKSTLTDRNIVSDALSAMKRTKFAPDNSAPSKECDQWTFTYDNNSVDTGETDVAKRKPEVDTERKAEIEEKNKTSIAENGGDISEEGIIFNDERVARDVEKRVFPKNLAEVNGRIVFNICINQSGSIIYAKYNRAKSTLTDTSVVSEALAAMKKTVFARDSSAPAKECGQWTINFKSGQ